MDGQASRPRASRKTFSCTECRRRKQKCNQEQPCNNCRRRFPEPVCEYGRQRQQHAAAAGHGGLPTFVLTPAPGRSMVPAYHVNHYPRRLPPSWTPTIDRRRRPGPGLVVRWSGVNMTTEYPVCDDFEDDEWETLLPTNEVPSSDRLDVRSSPRPSISPTSASGQRSRSRTPSNERPTGAPDSLAKPIDPPWSKVSAAQQIGNLWAFAGPVHSMGGLPINATRQNAVLIHTFSELLYHFKGSFDGVPDPDNPFVNHYVPWCLQSPLLAQTSLYISARSLAERRYIDPRSAMKLKGQAIHSLNEHLRSDAWIGDEAMAAVVQFISIEWFFGKTEVVLAHLKGLREMVRLRGGFTTAGVGALVTKVALVDDCVIALSLDSPPVLQREPGINFQYAEPAPERFIIRHNSPLLPGWVTFRSCADVLGLHPTTALVLDDIRFLISATLELPANPPPEKVKKLQKTAQWIHDRICQLPVDLPGTLAPVQRESSSDGGAGDGAPNADDLLAGASRAEPHSLLPSYPKFSSNSTPDKPVPTAVDPALSDEPSPHPAAQESRQQPAAGIVPSQAHAQAQRDHSSSPQEQQRSPPPPTPNPLYTAVRLAAPIYARAIATRSSLFASCSATDALQVLGATWRVPLARWRAVVGIFLFILAPTIATVTKHGRRSGVGGEQAEGEGGRDGEEAVDGRETRQEEKEERERRAEKHGGDGKRGDRATAGAKETREGEVRAKESPAQGSGNNSEKEDRAADGSAARQQDGATGAMDVESLLAPHAGFVKSILQIGFMQIALEDWPVCADMMGRLLGVQRWLDGEVGGVVGTPPWQV